MLRLVLVAAVAALAACSGPVDRACVPGASVPCSCPSGASGAQVCTDDGLSLGECVCEVADAGMELDASDSALPIDADATVGDAGPLDADTIDAALDDAAIVDAGAPDARRGDAGPVCLLTGQSECPGREGCCPDREACYHDSPWYPWGAHCDRHGARAEGDICELDTQCDIGMWCAIRADHTARCSRYCDSAADCEPGELCTGMGGLAGELAYCHP